MLRGNNLIGGGSSAGGVVLNPNLVMLLHMEGEDDGTSFIDSSSYERTFTARNNAVTDTAQAKFGTASLANPANGDYIDTPDASELTLGTGEWSTDAWIMFADTVANTQTLWGQDHSSSPRSWGVQDQGSSNGLACYLAPNGRVQSYTRTEDVWHHIEVNRTGGKVYHFKNGTQLGTEIADTTSVADVSIVFSIGAQADGTAAGFEGWMDEFRMLVGEGGHTDNFSVKTTAYDGSEAGDY